MEVDDLISKRIKNLKPSATLRSNAAANNLKSQGIDIISLALGEPSESAPDYIKEAAIDAIKHKEITYTSSIGIKDLREEIKKYHNDLILSSNPYVNSDDLYCGDDIIVTPGSKQGIFNLFFTTLNPGDEVIIPEPAWPSYMSLVDLFEGKSVILKSDENFVFKADDLKKLITPRTKFILINSPNNPTGAIYSEQLLNEVIELVLEHKNLYIISDDIYIDLNLENDDKIRNLSQINPKIIPRLFLINGLSKSHCMTGWRMGWLAAKNTQLLDLIGKINSQSFTSVCTIAQYAALAALKAINTRSSQYTAHISSMLLSYRDKLENAVSILNQVSQIRIVKPKAAFYLFIDLTDLLKASNKTVSQIVEDLLLHYHVQVLKGESFGRESYIRLSFSSDIERVKIGCNRIVEYFKSITIKN